MNPEMRSNFQQIIYCLGLHTENPGLRQVDLGPSPKGGNKEETPKRKQVVSYSLDSNMDSRTYRGRLGTQP